jgi:two-component system sensor histidine kinase BaeS
MKSLRSRLLAATALVLLALVFVAWMFSSIAVKRQFDRFLIAERLASQKDAVEAIDEHLRATGSWQGIEPLLAQLRVRGVVVDRDGRVLARHPRELAAYRMEVRPNGELLASRSGAGTQESLMLKGPAFRLPDAFIYLLGPEEQPALRRSFHGIVDRWLFAGLAVAALAAFATTLMIFRRVFAPVEALTAGARALAAGRLDARVAVSGRDEIGELAQSFNHMAAALERDEQVRRNMVSDVAHELRTPLTNLRCQIEGVQDGVVAADARLFQSLAEETRNLSALVDDLQQLSLADAGHLKLELAEVSVREIVERSIQGFRGPIECDVDELTVRADLRRAVQILRNLLLNAEAHARSRIAIIARRAGDFTVVTVADDGPGIPAEHLERIFDRFHRVDASRSRRTGGAGLGLAIARELVHLHGGTISARNSDNGGAELTFTLPFIRSS